MGSGLGAVLCVDLGAATRVPPSGIGWACWQRELRECASPGSKLGPAAVLPRT